MRTRTDRAGRRERRCVHDAPEVDEAVPTECWNKHYACVTPSTDWGRKPKKFGIAYSQSIC